MMSIIKLPQLMSYDFNLKIIHFFAGSTTQYSLKMEGAISENIANALSTLTILSCLFLKVPQIIYIREKQSAEGIFVQAMIMEIIG